jgi:hypothetical protein
MIYIWYRYQFDLCCRILFPFVITISAPIIIFLLLLLLSRLFVCLLFFPLSPIFYFADFLPTSIKDKLKRKRINFGRLDCGTGSQLIISKVRLGPMICGGVWPASSGSLIDSRPVIHLNLWPGRLPPVYKDGFHRRTGYHTTGIFRSSQTAVSNSVTSAAA